MKHISYISIMLVGAVLEFLALTPKQSAPVRVVTAVDGSRDIASTTPVATVEPQEAEAAVAVDSDTTPAAAGVSGSAGAATASPPAEFSQPTLAEQMLAENNRIRAASGKPPQILDSRLCQAAQEQANYCASTGAFDHYANGNPRRRAARYGFPVRDENDLYAVKEILAGNFSSLAGAFNGWTHSSGHYATMLEDRPLAGFGVAQGRMGNIWCAVYGREHPAVASEPQQHPPTQAPAKYPTQAPQQAYQAPVVYQRQFRSCGPNGCGSVMQWQSYQRRGLLPWRHR